MFNFLDLGSSLDMRRVCAGYVSEARPDFEIKKPLDSYNNHNHTKKKKEEEGEKISKKKSYIIKRRRTKKKHKQNKTNTKKE